MNRFFAVVSCMLNDFIVHMSCLSPAFACSLQKACMQDYWDVCFILMHVIHRLQLEVWWNVRGRVAHENDAKTTRYDV